MTRIVVDQLVTEFKGDTSHIEKSISRVDAQLKKNEKSVRLLQNAFASAAATAAGFIAAYAGIKGLQALARVSDTYTNIRNRLKLVTSGTEELNHVQSRLIQVSDETFTSLSANATLFSRLSLSTKQLRVSTEDTIRATQALQQTFRISGATAAEAANSAIQFSQGLAAGALRGDEFRSVSEQNIRLLQLLADGFGKQTGEIKEMADAGQLTAEKIMPILIGSLEKLNQEAENISPTFEASFNKIKEKFSEGVDESIRAQGSFDDLGDSISQLSDEAKTLGKYLGVVVSALTDIANFNRVPEANYTPIPEDYGLGPQYTQRSQNDFNVALGGIKNVPSPGRKPSVPDKFYLDRNTAAAKKAAKAQEDYRRKVQKSENVLKEILKPSEKYRASLDAIEELAGGVAFKEAARNTGLTEGEAKTRLIAQATEEYAEAMRESRRETIQAKNELADFIAEGVTGFDDFRGAAVSALQDILRNMLRVSMGGTAESGLLGNIGGSLGGLLQGGISSIFGGGGLSSGALSLASAGSLIPGFSTGGSIMEDRTTGGPDNQMVALRKSRNERLTITRPGQSFSGGSQPVIINQNYNISTGVQQTVRAELARILPGAIKQGSQDAVNEALSRSTLKG